jgi:hypothetical protein
MHLSSFITKQKHLPNQYPTPHLNEKFSSRFSKQAGAVILTNKMDIKPKLVRRDREGHFILIKGTIQQEEITIINICVPNVGVPNFIKYFWT